MMGVSFKNQTITVIRPGVVVERGDERDDWTSATEHALKGCRLQPMATDEIHSTGGATRDAVVTRWKVYGPHQPNVTPRDRVRVGGVVYEIDGAINNWSSPTGRLAHSEFELEAVDG